MPVICELRAYHHDGEGAPLLRPLARLTSFGGYVATMPSGRDRRGHPECLALWRDGRNSLRVMRH